MKTERGFTLIELLVVIVIVTALAGLLLPVLWKARIAGLDTKCKNNMIQIGKALYIYRDDYLAASREWHPRTLRSLRRDYLKDLAVLICPRDDSMGKEGGKPPICVNQFAELDEGSSYMYEFNMEAVCSWGWESYLGIPAGPPDPGRVVDIDGTPSLTMWGEVKTYQLKHGDAWFNGQFGDGKKHAYSPTRFPIVRCFWHTDKPDSAGHQEIYNLSYLCSFFRSGTEWERSTQ